MAAFISIVKYLNDQPFSSSALLSQAASSQASSAREPLNSLTFLASRSAISLERGLGMRLETPSKIIKWTPARAKRSFSKSSSMAPLLPHSTQRPSRVNQFALAAFLVVEPSDVIEPFAMAGLGFSTPLA